MLCIIFIIFAPRGSSGIVKNNPTEDRAMPPLPLPNELCCQRRLLCLSAAIPTLSAEPSPNTAAWAYGDGARLQSAFETGDITAETLLETLEARIEALNETGPALRAVRALNPEAQAAAAPAMRDVGQALRWGPRRPARAGQRQHRNS